MPDTQRSGNTHKVTDPVYWAHHSLHPGLSDSAKLPPHYSVQSTSRLVLRIQQPSPGKVPGISVQNDINGAISKWSRSCHCRGAPLHVWFLESLDWARPLHWTKTNIVLQTIICKASRKADILITRGVIMSSLSEDRISNQSCTAKRSSACNRNAFFFSCN